MPDHPPQPLEILSRGPLLGRIAVPGDKSISHRAIMLGALAVGESRIEGLLEGEDVLATIAAMRGFGASIERTGRGRWVVQGVGVGGLLQPSGALDMGNSGTSARLLMGLVASHAVTATFVGDASLSRRPMRRIAEPLALTGAEIALSPGDTLPTTVRGIVPAIPIVYTLPVASAQVKSAVLLAGLNTPGVTAVIEPIATRDHSERMLVGFGADLSVESEPEGLIIRLRGEVELKPQVITVPGDPSAAAFWLVAATIVPGSEIVIENVGLNPTRDGLIRVLRMMGAHIVAENERVVGGEPVADLHVRHASLRGIAVPPDLAPAMIDEFPALFVAAALARGRTIISGAQELRVKESDRIAAMSAALQAVGAAIEETPDGAIIAGRDGDPFPGGARIAANWDHRIAMAMAIAGLAARAPVTIDDMTPVATSYPGFVETMNVLTGAQLPS